MTNHPNRSRRSNPAANPRPDEIRAARESLGLTQSQAAALISWSLRAWQSVEDEGANGRRMPPVTWRAWKHLAGIERLPFGSTSAA